MAPDAPVQDFVLPLFGDDGYKVWELRGDTGKISEQELFQIKGMKLRIFEGGAEQRLTATIRSPNATVVLDEKIAAGPDQLWVTAPQFSIEGVDWTWDGGKEMLTVRRNVRVIFKSEMADILK